MTSKRPTDEWEFLGPAHPGCGADGRTYFHRGKALMVTASVAGSEHCVSVSKNMLKEAPSDEDMAFVRQCFGIDGASEDSRSSIAGRMRVMWLPVAQS